MPGNPAGGGLSSGGGMSSNEMDLKRKIAMLEAENKNLKGSSGGGRGGD